MSFKRDYETALQYVNEHLVNHDDVSPWASNFHLYLLAKNDMAAEANTTVAHLETLGSPGIDRFLDWYVRRFELSSAGVEQVTGSFGMD